MKNLERFNENNSSLDKDLENTSFKDDLKTVKTNLFEIASEFLRNSSDFLEIGRMNLAKLNSEGKNF